jgi:hypothetical protein
MGDPYYYIALCARKYAEATRQLVLVEDAQQRCKLEALLNYLKESAVYESEPLCWVRRRRLPEDLSKWIDRRADVKRPITSAEAELLRDYYAVPSVGVLGTLSSAQLVRLADLYEGWSCTPALDHLLMARLQGMADASRSMATFLGSDHEPHDPPARSILRFIDEKVFPNSED